MNPNERLYDDSNAGLLVVEPVVDGVPMSRGHKPRDYGTHPQGFCSAAPPFGLTLIPRSEWPARIKKMEAEKSRLSDIVRAINMPPLNQNGTNYCWANAPVNCVRIIRAVNNLPFVDLSPASVACPINGYKNQGGWGTEALERIVSHGCTSVALWPANAIDRQYTFNTPTIAADAAEHKVTEWWDLTPKSFDEMASCLLMNIPVAVGYNWWSHEVTAMDLVETSPGKFGVRIWNSWGEWEDGGFAVLSESKGRADDQVAPRVTIGSV